MIEGSIKYSTGQLIGSTSLSIYLRNVDRPLHVVINDIGLRSDAPFFRNDSNASINAVVYAGTVTICDNRDNPEVSQVYAVIQIVAQCDITVITQSGVALQIEPLYS